MIGAALAVLGYLGTLIGGLIKAAVSRQREYLADASAVQFTRNPGGLAGALKRIGSLVLGSTIKAENAAEANHMFFAAGIWEGVTGLTATHPPLEARIRRLDPAWDGKYPPAPATPAVVAEIDGQAAGLVGTAAAGKLASLGVVRHAADQVGDPTERHRRYAAALVQRLPDLVKQSAREPYGARAVLFGLLTDKKPAVRERQLARLAEHATPDVYELTLKLLPALDGLDVRARLPVVDMALPSLRAMSRSQYDEFIKCFEELVQADNRLGLFEWTLYRILLRHLRPQYEKTAQTRPTFYGLQRMGRECSVLLSTLAHADNRRAEAPAALARGAEKLRGVPVRASRSERVRPGAAQPGPGFALPGRRQAAAPCGGCVRRHDLRRPGGDRGRSGAVARRVRHARLPDAAAVARRPGRRRRLGRSRRGRMSLGDRHERLRRRADLLARLRGFFAERGFLEVETPLVDDEIIPELHIKPFEVAGDASRLWLQASPELHMKRLLAEDLPAIYQVTRSFRRDERGRLHNPEFTIVEWYRTGDDLENGVDLLDSLCQSVAQARAAIRTTYGGAFQRHAGVDPHAATCQELAQSASRLNVPIPDALNRDDRDEWLNLLLATTVEPHLGAAAPEILVDYPASQAALAATVVRADGVEVAERFELYWRGIELANGYHELTDAIALRERLENVNRQRTADNRPALPLPERLLAAMKHPGLPPCTGCALGFDRLVMLACGASSINDVMTFASPVDMMG